MSKDETAEVFISDAQSSIRLKPTGPRDAVGYPTWVDIHAGPFTGTLQMVIYEEVYAHLSQQLKLLHEQLSGAAHMGNPHDDLYLTFTGNGLGTIKVDAEAIGHYTPLTKLIFAIEIDQTYLPGIIRAVDELFTDKSP